MKVFVALAALLQLAHCGHVSVKLPYLSPAGVTYVSGYEGHAAALPYANGAVHYAAPAAPLHYAPAAIPAKVEAHHVGYAAAQVPAVAAVPFVKNVPTVSQVPVTTFEHHPAVVEKQVDVVRPAISTKKIEVRRPAIQKQFYDIEQRTIIRPAGSALVELDEPTSKLQKGPAIVQPLAHGAVLAQAPLVAHAQPAFAAPIAAGPAFSPSSTPGPILASTAAPIEEEAVVVDNADFRRAQFQSLQQTSSGILQEQQRLGQEQQRQFQFEQQRFGQEQRQIQFEQQRLGQEQQRQFQFEQRLGQEQQRQFQQEQQRLGQEQQRQFQQEQQSRSAFFNEQQRFEQGQQQQQAQFQEQSRSNLLNEQQQQFQLQQQELLRIGQEQLQRAQQMHQQFQLQQQQQQLQLQQEELNQLSRSNQFQQLEQQRQLQQQQSFEQQQQFQPAMERRFGPTPMQQQQINEQQFRSAIQQNQISGVETRSNGSPLETLASIASQEQGPSLVPSLQSSSEENQINQNKLIDLLTARGGVTEIGVGRDGQLSAIGDAGQIRARVLSATPAPFAAEPANEHISTKRVVVSRPIETLQELDVVEPATKVERIAVQHPTFIKTARVDHVQVHGSVPVVGKALTPAVAHAAVPVYQKTISPAYDLYH